MSPYSIAWLVAGGAGLVGTATMVFWTRHLRISWLRRSLCVLPMFLLLAPVGVPDFPDTYAPAFVVAIFEALFQTDGRPFAALRMLLIALAIGIIIVIALGRFRRGKAPAADSARGG